MKYTKTITSNASVLLGKAQRAKDTNMYEATIIAYGTFDTGTLTIQASPNQGVTLVNLRDIAGTVVSITADDAYNVRLGDGAKNGDYIELYATMAGAGGSVNVVVDVFDNM